MQPVAAPLADGRLATTWQGTQVSIGGVAAPLLSVQSAEILAVVPAGAAPGSMVPFALTDQRVGTPLEQVTVAAVPGVFLAQGTQSAILNSDSTWNSSANPAAASSVVSLFLIGAGLTDPV